MGSRKRRKRHEKHKQSVREQLEERRKQAEHQPIWVTVAERVLGLPRSFRIFIAVLVAIAVVVVVRPVIDDIYLREFFSDDTRMLPALVATALGAVVYVLGWYAIVGWVGDERTARPLVLWYLGFGIIVVGLALIWLLRLLTLNS